jgi:hypothetical protein
MDCDGALIPQAAGLPDYTQIGSTYMQTRRLPDYVNSNSVISIRDVADRAIQMWKGGPVVKYDDTSRYRNTFGLRDPAKQFNPSANPLTGNAQPTGVFQVPMPCPAPAIFIANTPAASNKVIWGSQIDTITNAATGFSRLIAPLSHYLVLRSNDPMGPWTVIDSVGRHDVRHYVSTAALKNIDPLVLGDSAYVYLDESTTLGQSFFYAVASVDMLGGKSKLTNITLHNTQTPAVTKLGHVYAAPNPFIVNSGETSSSSGSGGDASHIIYFCGLTRRATIRIFSYSGQLVKTIEHESVDPVNSQEGQFSKAYFQISRNEQWVASGVYYFVVEDKDTGDRAWNKFVIIH